MDSRSKAGAWALADGHISCVYKRKKSVQRFHVVPIDLKQKKSGNDLLSHAVSRGVPSALEGLTSVFGMGTGVTPPI